MLLGELDWPHRTFYCAYCGTPRQVNDVLNVVPCDECGDEERYLDDLLPDPFADVIEIEPEPLPPQEETPMNIHRILPLGTQPERMLCHIEESGSVCRDVDANTEWRGAVAFIAQRRVWAVATLHDVTPVQLGSPNALKVTGYLWCFSDLIPIEGVEAPDPFEELGMFDNGAFRQPQFLAAGAQVHLNRYLAEHNLVTPIPSPDEDLALELFEATPEFEGTAGEEGETEEAPLLPGDEDEFALSLGPNWAPTWDDEQMGLF